VAFVVDIDQLAPDEPLSPELVLVFSPELRAQALACLPAPVWATLRPRHVEVAASPVDEPFVPSLGGILVARVTQLALVFAAVTILTLAMSLVANAMR
jgi:hypothetical protein